MYSKDQQLGKEPRDEKEMCRVVGCFILKAKGDNLFCKGHRKAFIGSQKPSKVKRSYKKGAKRNTPKSTDFEREKNKTKAAFQRLRRAECAGEVGDKDTVFCRSTGKRFHWDDGRRVHGGHLISAKNKATMLSRENVWPQSAMANFSMGMGHSESRYIDWFVDTFGREAYDKLLAFSKQTKRYTIEELKILREVFELELHIVVFDKKLTTIKKLPNLGKKNKEKLKEYIDERS